MERDSRLVVVVIHGLPEDDQDPFTRMTPIINALAESSYDVFPLSWLDVFPGNLGVAIAKGDFGNVVAAWLDSQLRSIIGRHKGEQVAVAFIVYSAGGLGLYRWVAQESLSQELLRAIASVTVIAGPDQVAAGQVLLEPSGRRMRVGEPLLTKDEVQRITGRLSGRLQILLGDKDQTIEPDDAFFGDRVATGCTVREIRLQDASHLSICSDERTISTTLAFVEDLDPTV